jgi:hypothetical protein
MLQHGVVVLLPANVPDNTLSSSRILVYTPLSQDALLCQLVLKIRFKDLAYYQKVGTGVTSVTRCICVFSSTPEVDEKST